MSSTRAGPLRVRTTCRHSPCERDDDLARSYLTARRLIPVDAPAAPNPILHHASELQWGPLLAQLLVFGIVAAAIAWLVVTQRRQSH